MREERLFNEHPPVNAESVAILRKTFPQCFDKDGNFDFAKFQTLVSGQSFDVSKESYSLNWLGKSYSRLLSAVPPTTLLFNEKEHNSKPENKDSQNLLIKGDNLEVLKHLVFSYSGAFKMIYIDPPYNKGDDFVYDDNRKFTKEQLCELAGIDEDEAIRILNFVNSKSSSHSAWLTFMYPRIHIAQRLLDEDGVIFISIDDNEATQLKMLCDEIFGEECFITNFIWEKRTNRENRKVVSTKHDYILCYINNRTKQREIAQLPMNEKALANYKNIDNDPEGEWKSDPATAQAGHATESQFYELIAPNGKVHKLESGRCWVYTWAEMQKEIAAGRIWFGKDGNGVPRIKTYLHAKERGLTAETILYAKEVGTTENAKNYIKELFDGIAVFETPKPVELIKLFARVATNKDSYVLDFFAGSGTTHHAVLNLNAEDGGQRKVISVQIDEPVKPDSEAAKTGYKTVFEITEDRLLRAARLIKKNNSNKNIDVGFKKFSVITDFRKNRQELEFGNFQFFNDALLNEEQENALISTWSIYDSIQLHKQFTQIDLGGYIGHYCDNRLYLISANFNTNHLKNLLQLIDEDKSFAPQKVVFYGENFDSAKQIELNEALKGYANKKSLELDVVVRY